MIFRTSSTFFQLFLHLIPFYFFIHYNLVFIHLLVLFIILSFSCLSPGGILQLFMLLHLFSSMSFHQVPNVIFFSIFSKHFFWFSLWLVLSSIIFFLHQLGKNRYGDLLLLSLLAKTSKTVLKIKGACNTENPLPREQSHLQVTTNYLFSSWYTDSPGKPLLLVTFQWDDRWYKRLSPPQWVDQWYKRAMLVEGDFVTSFLSNSSQLLEQDALFMKMPFNIHLSFPVSAKPLEVCSLRRRHFSRDHATPCRDVSCS